MATKKKKVEEVEEVEETTEEEHVFGVRDLCALILEETGKEYNPREVRNLLRKMAREDKPRIDREIIAGNKSRYEWPDGADDPEVQAVLEAVSGGEIEEAKKAALDKLKADKAKKDAAKAKKAPAKKTAKGKKAPPPADDDEEDFEEDDD